MPGAVRRRPTVVVGTLVLVMLAGVSLVNLRLWIIDYGFSSQDRELLRSGPTLPFRPHRRYPALFSLMHPLLTDRVKPRRLLCSFYFTGMHVLEGFELLAWVYLKSYEHGFSSLQGIGYCKPCLWDWYTLPVFYVTSVPIRSFLYTGMR